MEKFYLETYKAECDSLVSKLTNSLNKVNNLLDYAKDAANEAASLGERANSLSKLTDDLAKDPINPSGEVMSLSNIVSELDTIVSGFMTDFEEHMDAAIGSLESVKEKVLLSQSLIHEQMANIMSSEEDSAE